MKNTWCVTGLSLVFAASSPLTADTTSSSMNTNRIKDAGFETITGSEPNAKSAPWFTPGEDQEWSFVASSDHAHSGKQSAAFSQYYDSGAIVQNLDIQIDPNKTYEVSIWVLIDNQSQNPAHTNAPALNIGLYTSPAKDSTYSYRRTLLGGATLGTTNEWEMISTEVAGYSLADWAGEYIRICFTKFNEQVSHRIYIDDAVFSAHPGEINVVGATVGKWTMDYEAAIKLAEELKLPLLLNFTGSDWCGWCKIMEENVFSKPEWSTYAQENLVMVFIDFPRDKSRVPDKYKDRNDGLKKEYGVRGYPTYVVLDDDGTTELGRLRSGRDKTPDSFRAELENLLRFKPSSVEAFIATLSPENQETYRTHMDKQSEDKKELAKQEKIYSESRSKVGELKRSIQKTSEEMRQMRVAELSDDEQMRFKELRFELDEAKKKRSDWLKTKPDQNEENKELYKTMQTEISKIEATMDSY